jgi:hypothetical protein
MRIVPRPEVCFLPGKNFAIENGRSLGGDMLKNASHRVCT